MPAARKKPGTERFRDEKRTSGGPKMHGRQWHDHEEPKDFEPEAMAGAGAVVEAESGGDRTGMGRRAVAARQTQSRERRKRMTPVSKGPKKKPGAAKTVSRSGMKGRGRAGNPG
jgi:hypothetical protein